MKRFAVIGAGLAGLTIARNLKGFGDVTLFEKSRGVGGRMATRYTERYQFDHGVQFFTAKTKPFQDLLQPWIDQGAIARWDARFVELDRNQILSSRNWSDDIPHYVASPKMNQLGKIFASGLEIRRSTLISRIHRRNDFWLLFNEEDECVGHFDWVISAVPAPQAAQILPETFQHYNRLKSTRMLGCHALMMGLNQPLPVEWQAALVKNSALSWISINSSKPGRPDGLSIVAHASNQWSEEHLEEEAAMVQTVLVNELSEILGRDLSHADHVATHRWRYANIDKQSGDKSLVDTESRLAACGDWCIRGRVEAAFSSANDLSEIMHQILAE